MSMICSGCKNADAYHVHGWYDNHLGYQEICDKCGEVSSSDASIPDVFWNGRPYYSDALQVEFTSRSQKARVMKERGVSELGSQKLTGKNWIDGSRESRRKQFEQYRPAVRETAKRIQEIVRRQKNGR